MLLGDPRGSHVVLEVQRESYAGGHAGQDVWITVKVQIDAFTGSIASCVARSDWDAFIVGLSSLEQTRRGEVILSSAASRELRLRIFAKGSRGTMAIDADLQRMEVAGEPSLRFSGVEFQPDILPALLQELREGGRAV